MDFIEFVDTNGTSQQISCHFSDDEHKGKSKCLLILAKKLKIDVDDKMKLDEFHQVFSNHPEFRNVSPLEKLPTKYQIKIVFNPKYHCELDPIEGIWCSMKRFVRKKVVKLFRRCFDLFLMLAYTSLTEIFNVNFSTFLGYYERL